jgi:transposase
LIGPRRDHDIALVDTDGAVVARSRIGTGAGGFNDLLALIAEHGGSAEHTPIALETDKNLLVVALAEAGFTVYPINPRAVARYRERYRQAGGKSDPGDAAVLAHILRTDRHLHRPLPAVSDQARAVKALARQQQEAVWALQYTINRLRSMLLEFYPQALQAFPNLTHKAAVTVLAAVPTPAAGQKLTRARLVALLRRAGRGNHPALVEQILADLRTPRVAAISPHRGRLRHHRRRPDWDRRGPTTGRRPTPNSTGPRVRHPPPGGHPAFGARSR